MDPKRPVLVGVSAIQQRAEDPSRGVEQLQPPAVEGVLLPARGRVSQHGEPDRTFGRV